MIILALILTFYLTGSFISMGILHGMTSPTFNMDWKTWAQSFLLSWFTVGVAIGEMINGFDEIVKRLK